MPLKNPIEFIRTLPFLEGIGSPPEIGTTAYFVFAGTPWFAIEVKITAIDFFLYHQDNMKSNMATTFRLGPRYPNGYHCYWPTEGVDASGWNKWREPTEDELRSCKVTCWEVDFDFPLGHAERIDEKYGPLYLNVTNAINSLVPLRGRKRVKASFLHRAIRGYKQFIQKTHGKGAPAIAWPHYPRYGERKIYNRRK
jgi:hypothetical protein